MTAFNQAGALVHVYQDGSIHLNHGGTEMGQGLYTKVAQVIADCFQVDLDRVKITATTTGKVPNTSATAASSGTDLNGMAAYDAARQIKERLVAFAAENGRSRKPMSNSCRTASASAPTSSPSPISSHRPISPASSSPPPASTRRRKSTGTAQPARAARSITSPMVRPSPKSLSIRSRANISSTAPMCCTMSAIR